MAYVDKKFTKIAMLVFVTGIITLIQMNFVGDLTIYSLQAGQTREISHNNIVHNTPPVGGWSAVGLNSTNIRIGIPYTVEAIHQVTSISVVRVYKVLDILLLWSSLIILFAFLRFWFSPLECLLTCLYFAAIMPLTFAFHTYQPWDRASFTAWLLGLWAARGQRFWLFLAVCVVAVFIKFDALFLPGLYFLANVKRENWKTITAQTCLAGAVLLGIFIVLRILLPGGFESRDVLATIFRNVKLFASNPVFYAPFLAFGLPVLLAAIGYMRADQFMRASLWFAAAFSTLAFATANFEEVRALQMLFPLIAPAAMLGLRRMLAEPLTGEHGYALRQ